jgi:hypothetical protein
MEQTECWHVFGREGFYLLYRGAKLIIRTPLYAPPTHCALTRTQSASRLGGEKPVVELLANLNSVCELQGGNFTSGQGLLTRKLI